LCKDMFESENEAKKWPSSSTADSNSNLFDGLLRALRKIFYQSSETQGMQENRFPIFIRIVDLSQHILKYHRQPSRPGPSTLESPAWLVDYLQKRNEEMNWGLDPNYFRDKLNSGSACLLLDGLDEAPGRVLRESIARLFEHATTSYPHCNFAVTTRPLSYFGQAVLDGFQEVHIAPLENSAIRKFLQQWCNALYPDSPERAEQHFFELSSALDASSEIH